MVRQRDEIYNENYLDKFYVEDFHLEVKKHGLIFKIWNLKQIPRFSPDKNGAIHGTDIYLGDELIHSYIGDYRLLIRDEPFLSNLIETSFNKKMKL